MTTRLHTASFSRLLQTTLRTVAEDVPEAHERLVAAQGSLILELAVGGELFYLSKGAVSAGASSPADVYLSLGIQDLVKLVEGHTTLSCQLASNRLELIGTVQDLARVDRVVLLLLHGVLRSRRAPDLMHSLRMLAEAAQRPHESTNLTNIDTGVSRD